MECVRMYVPTVPVPRRIHVPAHRHAPLVEAWMEISTPIDKQMKVDVRMNTEARVVELMARADTDVSNLQKSADFVQAFIHGFDLRDAARLLSTGNLCMLLFVIHVKPPGHLSRAMERLADEGGETKYAIEKSTKTKIVIAGNLIHILGSYADIMIAQKCVSSLIMGSSAANDVRF
ncbi:hypothetical protein RJ639_012890 [Escallonia herrerae]|uniref:PNO1 second type I KH domain-containing protein n=1 Tax=Escallonia herrerae TaxID=1293975 RepID=A0AA88VLW1_9ASTE|nr:hypothetical protein RJ639_012890 [Escallonia herrerae]